MRFLILDAQYPAFLEQVYDEHPHLRMAPYDEQLAQIREGLFAEAGFQVDALRRLGHEAAVIVTNAHPAQRAWAQEHGLPHLAGRGWSLRLRRGLVPWLTYDELRSRWELLVAQVREYKPDVLYVGILGTLPPAILAQLKPPSRLVVAQVATSIPDRDYRAYDLVLSSIPAVVDRFRRDGIKAELVPLAFEPSILARVPAGGRDVPVSFVGSFSAAYLDRAEIMDAVARVAPLRTWTADARRVRRYSALASTISGPAFGRDMYEVLARSQITMNTHGAVAGEDANNLRLYEATGTGALLITDHRRNLGELFEVGSELVSFGSPAEAAEVVRYYLDHPDEAARIAAAGQARTLRDHTWMERMSRLVASVKPRL